MVRHGALARVVPIGQDDRIALTQQAQDSHHLLRAAVGGSRSRGREGERVRGDARVACHRQEEVGPGDQHLLRELCERPSDPLTVDVRSTTTPIVVDHLCLTKIEFGW